MLTELNLMCVTESELLQWQSRKLMHLAADRVLSAGSEKLSLFALAPLVKLDDAKARVVVNLGQHFSKSGSMHPAYNNPDVISITWDQVKSIAPALPQFKRRLDGFNIPVETWDLSELWDEWLVTQSCYERTEALKIVLVKLGFNDAGFIADTLMLSALVRAVLRPSELAERSSVPHGWRILVQNRDAILKKLRFDGHSDRTSFLGASISELIRINGADPSGFELEGLVEARDSGWRFQDLSSQVLESIYKWSDPAPFSMEEQVSLVFGAVYLRLFDELFYGQKDWLICFNLLRFAKYSLDSKQTDFLTAVIAASFPPEDLLSLNLPTRFYSHNGGSEHRD